MVSESMSIQIQAETHILDQIVDAWKAQFCGQLQTTSIIVIREVINEIRMCDIRQIVSVDV